MALLRQALLDDIPSLLVLIDRFSGQDLLLPKTDTQMRKEINDFWIYEFSGQVVACGALKVGWGPLAEIRTLAVHPQHQGLGYGKGLVLQLIEVARQRLVRDVFVLTYEKPFFEQFGFSQIDKEELPEKVWSDCIHCNQYEHCNEIAMILPLV